MCMFVYISADCSVFFRENTCLLTPLSVIFRCSTEALTVKHVVRVWLSHHVCERGSLCEHDLIFCCVTEKSLSILSPLMTVVVMILFVWTRPWWGKYEVEKFSPILDSIVWEVRGQPSRITDTCAEPRKVSEEEKRCSTLPRFLSIEQSGSNEAQTVERNIWRTERWDSNFGKR